MISGEKDGPGDKALGERFLGMFFKSDAEDAQPSDPPPDFDALDGATDAALDATGDGGATPKPKPDIRDVAFNDAYAQTGGADEHTDRILAAAAKFGDKNAEVQQTALEAVAAAIGADTAAVAKVLDVRAKALNALVATARKRGSEAQTGRTLALHNANEADHQRIALLHEQIATIQAAIKTRDAAAKQADATEAARQQQFDERVKVEHDRLAALAKIIAPSGENVK